MAWLSRVNFTAADVLSYTALNNLGNDDRAWGGDVNGGGFKLSNCVFGTGISLTTPTATAPLTVIGNPDPNGILAFFYDQHLAAGSGGGLALGGYYSGITTTAFALIKGLKNNATDGDYGGYLSFTTRPNGGGFAERMRITDSGRVGIGTGTPVSLLDVYNTAPNMSAATVQQIATTGTNYGISMGVTGVGAIQNTALWINVNGAASSNVGINIVGPVAGAGNFAIQSGSPAQSYFAGPVGIGASASSLLTVSSAVPNVPAARIATNATSGVNYGLQITAIVSGSASACTGLYLDSNGAASNIGINIVSPPAGTNNWALYSPATAFSYFGGAVFVGYTASNGPYNFQVNSQIFATSSTIATSDGNYKTDVEPIKDALLLVNALNPVTFNWKRHPVHNFDLHTGQIGFVAQQVEKVLGNESYCGSVIKHNNCHWKDEDETEHDEPFLGIAEGNLVALLCAAIQELTVKVLALEGKVQ